MLEQVHKFMFEEFTCYVLWEGIARLAPTKVVFAGADENDLARELDKHNIEPDGINVPVHLLLLERDNQRILIDTGAGVDGIPKMMGNLPESLAIADISPESITDVIITHVHFDHTGGLVDATGSPAFANATYWMTKGAHQLWTEDRFKNDPSAENDAYSVKTRQAIQAVTPQTHLFEPLTKILDGINIIPSYGHTANHVSVMVESNSKKLLITSDALVNEIHVDYPDWIPMWSTDQIEAIKSMKKVLTLATEEHTLLYACHFRFPGLGRIETDGIQYTWNPIST